jgi:hypothetical protein
VLRPYCGSFWITGTISERSSASETSGAHPVTRRYLSRCDTASLWLFDPSSCAFKLSTSAGELATDGRIAAVLMAAGKPVAASLIGGTGLALADANVSCPQSDYRGKLVGVAGSHGESWLTVEGELPSPSSLTGHTIFVEDSELRRAYPIHLVKPNGSRTQIYTKLDGVGFEACTGDTWEFIPTASWQRP